MSILLLIIGLLLFVGLVVVHELGHYLAARRNGVVAEEFGIGFPPRAWSRKLKNGTLFSLNWLPLGGFVRLKGENDADRHKGSFGAASLGSKVKIMVAGVVMNLLAALVLFTVVALAGMPQVIDNQFTVASDTKVIKSEVLVGYVEPGSPAAKAGLQQRDQIISFTKTGVKNDQVSCLSLDCPKPGEIKLKNEEELPQITESLAGQTVQLTYERDNQVRQAVVQLRGRQEVEKSKKTDDPKGYLGVSPTTYELKRSTWSAPVVAVGLTGQLGWATLDGIGNALGNLFTGNAKEAGSQVAGPVGIFVLLKDGSILGYQFILFIMAVISLTLAIMNILPIPALDGGRLFVTLLFRAIRRPLQKETEDKIHATGFALLLLLFVVITVVDVRRFW